MPRPDTDSRSGIDVLKVASDKRLQILRVTAILSVVVAVVAGLYFFIQPVRLLVSLQFRPTFDGAKAGRYPNQLPFNPTDITSPSVVQRVFEVNDIKQYCGFEAFRSGYFIEESSIEFELLDREFAARMNEPRLSGVDRERLETEYRARKDALPIQYSVAYAKGRPCWSIPNRVIQKALTDVLVIWAEEAEQRRGVLNQQVAVLTPAVVDVSPGSDASPLNRLNLVRTAIRRVIANVRVVERIPGAELVRLNGDVSLALVRTKLELLLQSQIEPLILNVRIDNNPFMREWVDQALAAARADAEAATARAQALRSALREYSGQPTAAAVAQPQSVVGGSGPRGSQGSGSDVQTLAPQIDATFIDRLLALAGENIEFRQDLTRQLVDAEMAAVDVVRDVSHYVRMQEAIRRPAVGNLPPGDFDRRLNAGVTDAKALITQFNQLYQELSRVTLRSGAGLYLVESPTRLTRLRSFTPIELAGLIAMSAIVSALLATAIEVERERRRRRAAAVSA